MYLFICMFVCLSGFHKPRQHIFNFFSFLGLQGFLFLQSTKYFVHLTMNFVCISQAKTKCSQLNSACGKHLVHSYSEISRYDISHFNLYNKIFLASNIQSTNENIEHIIVILHSIIEACPSSSFKCVDHQYNFIYSKFLAKFVRTPSGKENLL